MRFVENGRTTDIQRRYQIVSEKLYERVRRTQDFATRKAFASTKLRALLAWKAHSDHAVSLRELAAVAVSKRRDHLVLRK